MQHLAIPSLLTLCLLCAACGDDSSGDDGVAGSSSDSATDTAPTTTTGPADSSSGEPSTGGETEGVDSTGPGETSETGDTTGEPVETHWGALVQGTLFTDDLAMAQATHDAVAMGGQAPAMAAGDYGHDALLGTTLLGTTENRFVGIDQWDNLEGALAVYGDPMFQEAFGMLFAKPPGLELFQRREDWHGWGSLEAGDAGDHWFVVVRGHLASPDIDAMQELHDGIAAGGEGPANMLGDVAHVVWVGTPEDPQEFFAVDVWTDDTNIELFYGDPMFQEAFGMLFDAPPSVGVYGSTDWHQW